jgi:hypothetical protein
LKRLPVFLILALCVSVLLFVQSPATAGSSVSFGVFYSSLAPHGEWIPVDGGVFAWRPVHVESAWRPYLNGQWIWTDDGWYWDSDEPWAWATYHYGRWYYDDYYGWLWLPGYDWSPAWVEWRYGGDYVGWAPLGPYAVFDVNFGVYYRRPWSTPYHYWSFVDCGFMASPGVHQYVYRTENNTRFIGRTRTAGNVRYDAGRIVTRGPDISYVERQGNVRIRRAEVVDVNSTDDARALRNGERDRISVYRPRIEDHLGDQRPERPANVRDRERVPSLDTRDIDARRREAVRGWGQEIERMQQNRPQRRLEGSPETRDTRLNDRGHLNPGPVESPAQPRLRDDQRRAPEEGAPRFTPRLERTPGLNRGESVERSQERREDRPSYNRPGKGSPGEVRPMNRPEGREQSRRVAPPSRGGDRH